MCFLKARHKQSAKFGEQLESNNTLGVKPTVLEGEKPGSLLLGPAGPSHCQKIHVHAQTKGRSPRPTSTSPVSFSFSTKLSTSVSGPASSRRYSGNSVRGSFCRRTAGDSRQHCEPCRARREAWNSGVGFGSRLCCSGLLSRHRASISDLCLGGMGVVEGTGMEGQVGYEGKFLL